MALEAKLNDHFLTVSIYKMTKFELVRLVINLLIGKKQLTRKIDVFQGRKITVSNRFPRLIHADARLFGKTPFKCEVEPNALSVITGFPDAGAEFLKKRTPLDP
jgi:diacylglycerol kinase family enzyme